jgi:hypothetical protein
MACVFLDSHCALLGSRPLELSLRRHFEHAARPSDLPTFAPDVAVSKGYLAPNPFEVRLRLDSLTTAGDANEVVRNTRRKQ